MDENRYHLLSLNGEDLSFMSNRSFERLITIAREGGQDGKSPLGIARSVVKHTYNYMKSQPFNCKDNEAVKMHTMLNKTIHDMSSTHPKDDIIQDYTNKSTILTRARMRTVKNYNVVTTKRSNDD